MADIRQAIEYAKKNPDTPFATELRRRIESGQMDAELKAAGIGGKPQAESGFVARVKDIPGDIKEAFGSSVESVSGAMNKAGEIVSDVEQGKVSTLAGTVQTIGTGLRAGAEVIGHGITGAAKVFTSPATEQKVSEAVDGVAANVANSDPVQSLIQKYESLSPEKKAIVDGTLGTAEGLVTLLTTAPASRLARGATKVGGEAIDATASGVRAGIDSFSDVAKQTVDSIASKVPSIKSIPDVEKKVLDFIAREPDAKTSTILKESSKENFDKYINSAREAAVDPRKITPYEMVGDSLTDATKRLKTMMGEIGAKKSEFLKPLKEGFEAFDAQSFVDDLVSLKNKTPDADKPYVQSIIDKARSVKTKGAADKLIDELQDGLYSANQKQLIVEGSTLDKQLKKILGKFNNSLKSSLPEQYAILNEEYSKIAGVVRTLSRALGEVVEGVPVRGASLVKQFFSPSGRKAKELFEFIKEKTGIDIAQDTTLARFAMELFDDPRARALLEGIPTSGKGFINWAIDKAAEKTGVGEKIKDTLRNAEINKARKMTK